MRLLKIVSDAVREILRPASQHFLDWDDFVSRVEARSGVLDTDKVLGIYVNCIQQGDWVDLCTLIKPRKRRGLKRLFFEYGEELIPRGYLVVWSHGGLPDWPGGWPEHHPPHDIAVPDYRERRAWESITWGDLKAMVRSHEAYGKHDRIRRINISACTAVEIEIGLHKDMAGDLIVSGGATADQPGGSHDAGGRARVAWVGPNG